VELLLEDGSHRSGFVAATGPLTSDSGEIVVRVALEEEYRTSKRERRSAVSMTGGAAGGDATPASAIARQIKT